MRTLGKWNRQGVEGGRKGVGNGYIYIYIQSAELLSIDPRRMWRPTEVTLKEREREREREREGGDEREDREEK